MPEMHEMTAQEQCAALHAKEISSVELVTHYLRRIEQQGDRLGAFVEVFTEQALAAAHAADKHPSNALLHGLPVPLKDLHPTAGVPTSLGSAAMAGWLPKQDGTAIRRLRRAGIIILGKTHAPEFGPCCYTESRVAPPAVTPYALALSASGSSGGAAAAVAAGLAPVAHASDGFGSTRTPASNCGLVGIKPSRGRIPSPSPSWFQIGIEGPVARTVGDAALFLDAIGPTDMSELWRGPAWHETANRHAALRPPGPLKIGLLTDPGTDQTTAHSDCLRACDEACSALQSMGHEIVTVKLPAHLRLWSLLEEICDVVSVGLNIQVQTLIPESRRESLMPYTRWHVGRAGGCTGIAYARSLARLSAAAVGWLKWQAEVDVLLSPTSAAPALPSGALRLDDGWASTQAMLRWSAFTPWANLCGSPAMSLPVHETADGLPVGIQLMGLPGDDTLLLGLAHSLEEVFLWHRRHPPGWSSKHG